MLTAAHCTEYIPQRVKNYDNLTIDERINECVEETKKHGVYKIHGIYARTIQCHYRVFKDIYRKEELKNLEITLVNPKGRVWIGVEDLRDRTQIAMGQTTTIKKAFRHAHSYRGGGTYGEYGGHDIALLELDTALHAKTACLPSPSFSDQDTFGQLAGYGKYLRNRGKTCETNQYGLSKHHYCGKFSSCRQDTPPPQGDHCKQFFSKVKDWSHGSKYNEALIDVDGTKVSCHKNINPENEDYGWCHTTGNYYSLTGTDQFSRSWGFCSKDCFLNAGDGDGQVLRKIDKAHVSSWFDAL